MMESAQKEPQEKKEKDLTEEKMMETVH